LSDTPDLITDLVQIQQLGEKKLDENRKFRVFMKTRDYSDRILRRTAERIEDRIDCTECGNCCKTSTTEVTERDIEKLARYLHTMPERFIADYTMIEEDEGRTTRVLRFTEGAGCVFLDGKLCSVYDARPGNCQRYPHVVRGNGSIASRMWQFIDRASVCPIVYNCLEAFKDELRFRR
jgi:hypothetical protein